ncbi:hypothetical protein EUGRSUZ_H00381 [Eucalyptus grandis]|uniref:Uncharacterized protein n=2 Tax=Eucalyptus grandis TaxID=71139 RepID=A0ACC3JLV7_EUCGR|nr:hypothetical protein EUGRSUZ_H00381 [Eucalyptus grandis]
MSLSFTETREWFIHVKTNFKEELQKDINSHVCVFQVPRSLSSAKPQAYAPQLVGLGPYHHLQPHLLEMERVKLDVVKKLHKESSGMSFMELVRKLTDLHLYVRACYHKFLDIDADVLSWIMTVDAQFLFHLLCQHDPDHAGKKLAEDAILRDVMMLENQIPIFFLAKMVTVACSPLEVTEQKKIEENFPHMLVGFCKFLSPLKETRRYQVDKTLKRAHLLDLLYSMVVEREDEFKIDIPANIILIEEDKTGAVPTSNDSGRTAPQHLVSMTENVLGLLQSPNLPCTEKIRPHAMMVQGIMRILSQQIGPSVLDSFGYEEAPAEEKGLISRASSLAKAGVKFRKTDYIEETSFDEKTHTFQLPAIKLSVNSEVVIRNLVAYEAMATSGPLLFTRFVELMDGLLDTPHDVRLLKKHGIITGHLKDGEVARLFNGMSHSIDGHCPSQLDKTIKKVNEFYHAAPKIKTQNMIERYVYNFWKFLAMVATILFFLLMVLQTFCSAYSCSTLLNKTK